MGLRRRLCHRLSCCRPVGLSPLGLERINFVLTPLEAELQPDICLLIKERRAEVGPGGLMTTRYGGEHKASS